MHTVKDFFAALALIKFARRTFRSVETFDVGRMVEYLFVAYGLPYEEDILRAVSDEIIDSKDPEFIACAGAKAWTCYYEKSKQGHTDLSVSEVFDRLKKITGENP